MMLLIVVVTCLVTLILIIISTIAYLISIISDDPGVFDDSEAFDAHQFVSDAPLSPVYPMLTTQDESAPVCTNPSHHHESRARSNSRLKTLSVRQAPGDFDETATTNASRSPTSTRDDNSASQETEQEPGDGEIGLDTVTLGVALNDLVEETKRDQTLMDDSTETNGQMELLEQQAGSGQQRDITGGHSRSPVADKPSVWEIPAEELKDKIISQLGVPASKHLFDDFDNREMHFGGTGLHWCKSRKSLDKLIRLGLPLDALNDRCETAVHVAVRRRRLQVLIGLLCHGATVNCRNSRGETPLIVACKMSEVYHCQLLLVFDADVELVDHLGYSARHHVANICDKHKTKSGQKSTPLAANLIMAMLNELGAKRCQSGDRSASPIGIDNVDEADETMSMGTSGTTKSLTETIGCSAGCSPSGSFNGLTYNKWPDFDKESLFKRHMFSDIIEAKSNPKEASKETSQRKSRMLCIDGGGLRGIIVCQIMIEVQKFLKKPLLSYFDWIGGTSVGAFVSCALCTGVSLSQLRRICFDVKDEIFSGNRPYNSKFLERVLKRTLGTTTKLTDLKEKNLVVTTVLADRDPCQLRFFRNYKSASDLLESLGYPADKFDAMSGHSIVIRRPIRSAGLGANVDTISKVASNGNAPAATSAPTRGETTLAKAQITDHAKQTTATRNSRDQIGHPSHSNEINIGTTSGVADSSIGTKASAESTTKSIHDSSARPNGPTNEHEIDENERNPCVWQAVRASAAAPFFFKPYGPFVDGGIISNNPTLDMLSEFQSYQSVREFIRQRAKEQTKNKQHVAEAEQQADAVKQQPNDQQLLELALGEPTKLDLVVSLGTGRGRVIGRQAIFDFSQFASGFSTVFSPVELVRSIRAARDLFKKLMQRSCHTEDHVLDRAQAWCASLKIPYFRINPPLASTFSIDDKRDEQLINAIWQAKLYMKAMSSQVEKLGMILDGENYCAQDGPGCSAD